MENKLLLKYYNNQIERIKCSDRYRNLLDALEYVFPDKYEVKFDYQTNPESIFNCYKKLKTVSVEKYARSISYNQAAKNNTYLRKGLCLSVIIYYPNLTISNNMGLKHNIKDLFVKFNLHPLVSGEMISLYGIRTTYTVTEVLNTYSHSHLSPDSISNTYFQNFCLGSSEFGASSTNELLSLDPIKPIQLLLLMDSYLGHESISGVPYRHISNLNIKSTMQESTRTNEIVKTILRRKELKIPLKFNKDLKISNREQIESILYDLMQEETRDSSCYAIKENGKYYSTNNEIVHFKTEDIVKIVFKNKEFKLIVENIKKEQNERPKSNAPHPDITDKFIKYYELEALKTYYSYNGIEENNSCENTKEGIASNAVSV